jgi:hypothetical protein
MCCIFPLLLRVEFVIDLWDLYLEAIVRISEIGSDTLKLLYWYHLHLKCTQRPEITRKIKSNWEKMYNRVNTSTSIRVAWKPTKASVVLYCTLSECLSFSVEHWWLQQLSRHFKILTWDATRLRELMQMHLQYETCDFSCIILDHIRLHWPPTNLFLLKSACCCMYTIHLAGINLTKEMP